MSRNSSKRRKDYIADIRCAYTSLQGLSNYRELIHHKTLEETVLQNKKLGNGELIDILQLAIIHDLHGENDPVSEEKQFEPEYARCITTSDNEFETRLTFVDALIEYARGSGQILNGKGIHKWRGVKNQLKALRATIKEKNFSSIDVQTYFLNRINESRQSLVQFNLYLNHAYHLLGKS